jgi:Spy/CpxP family protein refolding chaperone
MAQQGRRGFGFGGGFGGGANYVFMLASEKVQTELKLSDDQKAKLTALREEVQAAGRGGFGNFQDMTPEERTKAFADIQKRNEDNNKKVLALLNTEQNKRAKELALQQRLQPPFGSYGAVLADPEIVKELKLTDNQQASVKTIADAMAEKQREMFQGGGFDQAKAAELRTAADGEYLAVLTADQKAQLEKMKGAKFEFDPPQFGRGRRGNNN